MARKRMRRRRVQLVPVATLRVVDAGPRCWRCDLPVTAEANRCTDCGTTLEPFLDDTDDGDLCTAFSDLERPCSKCGEVTPEAWLTPTDGEGDLCLGCLEAVREDRQGEEESTRMGPYGIPLPASEWAIQEVEADR